MLRFEFKFRVSGPGHWRLRVDAPTQKEAELLFGVKFREDFKLPRPSSLAIKLIGVVTNGVPGIPRKEDRFLRDEIKHAQFTLAYGGKVEDAELRKVAAEKLREVGLGVRTARGYEITPTGRLKRIEPTQSDALQRGVEAHEDAERKIISGDFSALEQRVMAALDNKEAVHAAILDKVKRTAESFGLQRRRAEFGDDYMWINVFWNETEKRFQTGSGAYTTAAEAKSVLKNDRPSMTVRVDLKRAMINSYESQKPQVENRKFKDYVRAGRDYYNRLLNSRITLPNGDKYHMSQDNYNDYHVVITCSGDYQTGRAKLRNWLDDRHIWNGVPKDRTSGVVLAWDALRIALQHRC